MKRILISILLGASLIGMATTAPAQPRDRYGAGERGDPYWDDGRDGGRRGSGGDYGDRGRRGSGDYGDRVPPRWNSAGSAVCPNEYDFVRGWCRPRSPDRLPPRWNAAGSAVCPQGYDYRKDWCRPQH